MNPKEVREMWCQALESGEYKQGTHTLKSEDGYCCLGVLARKAIEYGVIENFDGNMAELSLELEPVKEWAGLSQADGLYASADGRLESLAGDNDDGKNFKEIAATIRSEPPGLVAKATVGSAS